MRSLLVAASFRPSLGGVETLLYETHRRLQAPPLVLAPSPAATSDMPVRQVCTPVSARLTYRPLWAVHPSLHYLQTFLGPASQAARTWRAEAILVGHVYLAPLGWLLARRFRVPYVVYAYGQEVWRAGRGMGISAIDARLRGAALRHADRVLVPGGFTSGLVRDWGVPAKRVVCVPFGAEPHPHTAPPTGKTLLSVARLVPRKGIDTVIRALRKLPSDVTYRVVGNGPDRQRLEALACREGVLDRVVFLGRVDDSVLADEYRRCALFVLPSRRTADGELEGYGLVYFEAAAWGRPVIAGRSGGEVDVVVDGETGLLVDGMSVPAVASALASLLNDPALLERLGAAGQRRVETTHNWTRAAAVVDATLRSL